MKIAIYSPDEQTDWQIVQPNPSVSIWLDEIEIKRVVAVDDQAGEVWVVGVDENGDLRVDRDKEEVILERLTGKVEIRLQ